MVSGKLGALMGEHPAVTRLGSTAATDAVDVLCDAFADYPVMRYVLGSKPGYDGRLRTLIGFFVAARVLRKEPVFGVFAPDGALLGAATVTPPGDRAAPDALLALRDAAWAALGADVRARYEAFGAASHRFDVAEPDHHLNMIGVRRSHTGQGLGRALLDAVHDLARRDPASSGVSLTTERVENVALYEHCGYRLLGRTAVAPGLETWSLFRRSGLPSPSP